MSNYSAFFAAHKASQAAGNTLSREEQISAFTGGRTDSLKELSPEEYHELVQQLNKAAGFTPVQPTTDPRADRMRKSIISIFYQMKRKPADAKTWAERQGVKGIKRAFNDYSTAELYVLIRIAEKILADWQTAIRKSLNK